MNYRRNQTGFSIVEIMLVLAVVAALVFVGYFVYSRQQDNKAGGNTSQSAEANDVPAASDINSVDDLDNANQTLDQVNLDDDKDSSQLDNELSNF